MSLFTSQESTYNRLTSAPVKVWLKHDRKTRLWDWIAYIDIFLNLRGSHNLRAFNVIHSLRAPAVLFGWVKVPFAAF